MQLKAAIVGAGLMGGWHAHLANRVGARVTSIIDRDATRGSRLASRYGAQYFTDAEFAFDEAGCDVIHICTPVGAHFDLATRALEAGLHVLVEKPLVATAAEATQLDRSATIAGRIICPVHQFPFQRGIARLRSELRHRASAPLCVEFDIASAGGTNCPEGHLDALVLEILPHPLSVLHALWPSGTGDTAGWQISRPRAGQIIAVGMHGDIPVLLKIDLLARPTRCGMTISHGEGAMEQDFFHDYAVFDSPRVSRLVKVTAPLVHSGKVLAAATVNLLGRTLRREWAYPGLESLVRHFYQAVATGGQAPIPAVEYIEITRTCDNFRRCLNSG